MPLRRPEDSPAAEHAVPERPGGGLPRLRMAVEAEAEGPSLRGLLAEPDMRRLVASVLAVVEREADAG